MKKYRVSFEDRFCRDVEVEAENAAHARELAEDAGWDEHDWCDGHELEVVNIEEVADNE